MLIATPRDGAEGVEPSAEIWVQFAPVVDEKTILAGKGIRVVKLCSSSVSWSQTVMLEQPIFASVTTVADPMAPAPITTMGNWSFSGGKMFSCRRKRLAVSVILLHASMKDGVPLDSVPS